MINMFNAVRLTLDSYLMINLFKAMFLMAATSIAHRRERTVLTSVLHVFRLFPGTRSVCLHTRLGLL